MKYAHWTWWNVYTMYWAYTLNYSEMCIFNYIHIIELYEIIYIELEYIICIMWLEHWIIIKYVYWPLWNIYIQFLHLNHNEICALNLMKCIIYYIHIHVMNLYKIYTLNMMKRMHYMHLNLYLLNYNELYILNLSCIKCTHWTPRSVCCYIHRTCALNYNDTLNLTCMKHAATVFIETFL